MSYITQSGDTWDRIAYNALGSGYYMDKMIAANQKYCDIFAFPRGVELEVPEAEEETTITLPPWFGGTA